MGLGCGDGAGLALGLARRKLPGDAAGGLEARGSFFTGVPAGEALITLASTLAPVWSPARSLGAYTRPLLGST